MNIRDLIEQFQLNALATPESDLEIRGVKSLAQAGPGDLSFLANPKYRDQVLETKASAVLVKEAVPEAKVLQLQCEEPYVTLAKIMARLFPEPEYRAGVHPSAVVAETAVIGEGSYIGPHCVVDEGVVIGERSVLVAQVHLAPGVRLGHDCKLFPQVVCYAGTRIGNRVRVHAGTVIGSDGFGYAQTQGIHLKVPQIGGVVIDDDVEIGSNVSIDRGALEDTVIGKGSKIDNLVQLAHGVKVGKGAIIVSQSGVSGSTKLGNYVVLAGQVGVVGHVEIADGIWVLGDSVVTKSLEKPGRYAGNPAVPHMQYQRKQAQLSKLPELAKRVKAIEDRLNKGEGK